MNNIRREITPDGLCVLTFDRSGSSANLFDRSTLEELGTHLFQTLEVANCRSSVGRIIACVCSVRRAGKVPRLPISQSQQVFVAFADNDHSRGQGNIRINKVTNRGNELFVIPTARHIAGDEFIDGFIAEDLSGEARGGRRRAGPFGGVREGRLSRDARPRKLYAATCPLLTDRAEKNLAMNQMSHRRVIEN